MKRHLMPATTLTNLKKIAFALLCCTVLMVFAAPAQTLQQIKNDPGTNDGPPAGAILDLANPAQAIPGGGNNTYQQYTVNFTATLTRTAITFAFREDPAFISFANVSVTDLTTPSDTILLTNGDFSGGYYPDPVSGNNFVPIGWTYANTYGAFAGGIVQSPGSCAPGYPNCWYDGAVQAYDAISQTIATNVGDNYQISFYVADNSGCSIDGGPPCNFSDLSTNGDITDPGGNGINVTVYAQAGLPPANQTLTVTLLDSGTGTVTDSTEAINCSEASGVVTGTCSASYAIGTPVTLTASPSTSPTFGGWGGACASSGTSPTCTVTMNSAQNVTASFVVPGQTQSGTVTTESPTTFPYNGGFVLNSLSSGYDMTQQLVSGSSTEVSVTAIPFASQAACSEVFNNTIFSGAQCFEYLNGGGTTGQDAAVGFEVTCPGSATGGTCGSSSAANFFATLGSDFYFQFGENPGLALSPTQTLTFNGGNPYIGVVKFSGPDPLHPCTLPENTPAPSASNQVISFNFIDGTPGSKPVKGGSSGTGSCWLFTYNMPGEAPTASITAPGNGQDYPLNSALNGTFTCTAANAGFNSATGPYLTVNTCTLTDAWTGSSATYQAIGGSASATASPSIDTSNPGPHTLTATVVDSATNTAPSSTVTYNVQGTSTTTVGSTQNPSTYGQAVSFTASVARVGTPTGTVQFTIDGSPFGSAVSLSGGSATSNSISTLTAGPHSVTAAYSGDTYNSTSTGTLSQVVNPASQTITLSGVPSSAAYNSSFTVAATGGASGNPVTFTSSGVCSNVGATYTMTNSTGTCSVIANQAGNTNYSAAPQLTQTVNATGPLLSLTPTSINLGTVYLFLDLNPVFATVKNIGTSTLNINNVSLTLGSGTNADDFTLINLCSSTLAPGKTCYISVVFFAGNVGTPSATLNVADNAPGSPQHVSLSATVINPQASLRPSSLNFGTIKVGHSSTQNVTLTNPGTTALTITSISVTGANAHDFVPSNACPGSLAPGAGCTIAVTFTPSATGSRSANLAILDNAIIGTQKVSLSGKGD